MQEKLPCPLAWSMGHERAIADLGIRELGNYLNPSKSLKSLKSSAPEVRDRRSEVRNSKLWADISRVTYNKERITSRTVYRLLLIVLAWSQVLGARGRRARCHLPGELGLTA